jgi:hypothetical protein
MTDAHQRSAIAGDASFVIACPACHGQLAAAASLMGTPACCPLCAAAFLVPEPRLAEVVRRPPLPAAEPKPEPVVSVVHQPHSNEGGDAAPQALPGLALREPVRMLGRGADAIELKRLSDEERRIRRGRRTIILLVVGVALLAALVMLLSLPAGRR